MRFRPDKVLGNARKSPTPELLDRVTVLRNGMEPEALEIIEAELARRGITPDEITEHAQSQKHRVIQGPDDLPRPCDRCGRAATNERAGWHRIWSILPLYRRKHYFCDEHKPPLAS